MKPATALAVIPPLSQSRHALLSCDLLYEQAIINKKPEPPNEYSMRGREIHKVISTYINHLVKEKLKTDLAQWATLTKAIPGDAGEILAEMGPKLIIDPAKVWATEVYICLDTDFKGVMAPTNKVREPINDVGAIAYEMTLDLVTLHDEQTAEITDWKSYYQVIEPDTFQGRLYSLGLFMLNPNLQKVIFRMEFVRWGVGRSVTFTREQVIDLQTEAAAYRGRQLLLHESERVFEATAGNHCRYCPLVATTCPLSEVLPMQKIDPTEIVERLVYFKQAAKALESGLRDYCKEKGPVDYNDGAGHIYRASWGTQSRKSYPLLETVKLVSDWLKQTKEDLTPKLTVSGLSTLLKAKKRSDLADELANVATVAVSGKFRIGIVTDDGEVGDDDAD